ncbi:YvrJ family protein [Halobacillus litoralis]|uniref:YvrJ family protein n=1 Tax=Halobacillus litoralis TaxID=45668 RepID=UPI001CD74E30|nr:YvrJ family protein [Halobacillus litoralis]MCA0972385.1 YvrJ family protein [Halobacillus litoralis]
MDYAAFAQLLGNVGFPIAVTIFLLVKLEKKMEQLESAIHTLSESVKSRKQ